MYQIFFLAVCIEAHTTLIETKPVGSWLDDVRIHGDLNKALSRVGSEPSADFQPKSVGSLSRQDDKLRERERKLRNRARRDRKEARKIQEERLSILRKEESRLARKASAVAKKARELRREKRRVDKGHSHFQFGQARSGSSQAKKTNGAGHRGLSGKGHKSKKSQAFATPPGVQAKKKPGSNGSGIKPSGLSRKGNKAKKKPYANGTAIKTSEFSPKGKAPAVIKTAAAVPGVKAKKKPYANGIAIKTSGFSPKGKAPAVIKTAAAVPGVKAKKKPHANGIAIKSSGFSSKAEVPAMIKTAAALPGVKAKKKPYVKGSGVKSSGLSRKGKTPRVIKTDAALPGVEVDHLEGSKGRTNVKGKGLQKAAENKLQEAVEHLTGMTRLEAQKLVQACKDAEAGRRTGALYPAEKAMQQACVALKAAAKLKSKSLVQKAEEFVLKSKAWTQNLHRQGGMLSHSAMKESPSAIVNRLKGIKSIHMRTSQKLVKLRSHVEKLVSRASAAKRRVARSKSKAKSPEVNKKLRSALKHAKFLERRSRAAKAAMKKLEQIERLDREAEATVTKLVSEQ
eukprot:TRINITY_DN5189_c0_g1_i8.p1 TRINITY_DN5189_c0_g1~~TRINITY_DN5189_c0_g1_i8.p1  ORF type:complete len:567 (+),score=96.37 TRINITY_DN5189_c0_g1_i8:96-1796(+)